MRILWRMLFSSKSPVNHTDKTQLIAKQTNKHIGTQSIWPWVAQHPASTVGCPYLGRTINHGPMLLPLPRNMMDQYRRGSKKTARPASQPVGSPRFNQSPKQGPSSTLCINATFKVVPFKTPKLNTRAKWCNYALASMNYSPCTRQSHWYARRCLANAVID